MKRRYYLHRLKTALIADWSEDGVLTLTKTPDFDEWATDPLKIITSDGETTCGEENRTLLLNLVENWLVGGLVEKWLMGGGE